MLTLLQTSHVGPAQHLKTEFAPRLNLLTGDNGLGKTFILDLAWRALTGAWNGHAAWVPQQTRPAKAVRSSTRART